MKRKADNDIATENGVLLKSLRRSVSDFLRENDASLAVLTQRKKLGQDPADECWVKYRQRLNTYPAMVKMSKPKEVSPAVCAGHGWRFMDTNFLQCDECNKVLCVSLPESPTMSMRIMRSCLRNIQRKLNEAHDLNCFWRTNGGLNLSTPYNIFSRYKTLKDVNINAVPLAPKVISEQFIAAFSDLDDRFCLISAVCGWLPSIDKNADRMCCLLCGRELSLVVFSDDNQFNPLEEHYAYCPINDKEFPVWKEAVNSVTQIKNEKEPIVSHVSRIKSMLGYIFRK